jgi:hypothetical protein
MTPIYISAVINVLVAIWIALLTIVVTYYSLIKGHKQLNLGEEEEIVVYGRKTKHRFIEKAG